MTFHPFLNSERQLRNGWWILIFFLVLASILVPTLIIAQQNSMDVSIGLQAVLIALVSAIYQSLRQKPLAELLGKFNLRWFKELCVGGLVGSALMLFPALIMRLFGWVNWQWNPIGFSTLLSIVLLFAGVAAAEELLFRGFVFHRLFAGLGQWPAQLILAGYFLLTHLNNPGMTSEVKVLAGVNIFLASIMFGLAFIRTRSLAMLIGLHFMANLMQGCGTWFWSEWHRPIGFIETYLRRSSGMVNWGPVWARGKHPRINFCDGYTIVTLHVETSLETIRMFQLVVFFSLSPWAIIAASPHIIANLVRV